MYRCILDVQCDPNAQVKDTFYHDDRICHTWLAGESFSFGLKDGGIGSPKQAQLSGGRHEDRWDSANTHGIISI